jgi:para-aminobenzoate synthetase
MEAFSRFSFMGDGRGSAAEIVTYRHVNQELTIVRNDGTERRRESILKYLRHSLKRRQVHDDEFPFDFVGGFVGFLGYEMKAECGATATHAASTPDAAFIFPSRFIAFDHQEAAVWVVHVGEADNEREASNWFAEAAAALALPNLRAAKLGNVASHPLQFRLRHNRKTYYDLIRRCKEHIFSGESYEICLTNILTARSWVDSLAAYRVLRLVNPAPYSAYVRLPGTCVLCSSPERFLKIDRNRVMEAKPIKGTIHRGSTSTEDLDLFETLSRSEKDRAENLMIVDLLRNDLGRVSELGSIHVPKLMDIQTFATVHQMVSTIRGRLSMEFDAVDALKASFPGGSMTGAPKIRTMEIIDNLEGGARGVYSGALGFVSLNGTLDLNIVIRTIVIDHTGLSIGCGGAITALSEPEAEFDDMILKARAPLSALAMATVGSENGYIIEGIDRENEPRSVKLTEHICI